MDTLDYDLAKDVLRRIVSYLPLAHIAGMVCTHYLYRCFILLNKHTHAYIMQCVTSSFIIVIVLDNRARCHT